MFRAYGIEVTVEDRAAWDDAVCLFQRSCGGRGVKLKLLSAVDEIKPQSASSNDGLAGLAALRWEEQ